MRRLDIKDLTERVNEYNEMVVSVNKDYKGSNSIDDNYMVYFVVPTWGNKLVSKVLSSCKYLSISSGLGDRKYVCLCVDTVADVPSDLARKFILAFVYEFRGIKGTVMNMIKMNSLGKIEKVKY